MPSTTCHVYLPGTFATCRPALGLSVYRGRPEVTRTSSNRRAWTQPGHWPDDRSRPIVCHFSARRFFLNLIHFWKFAEGVTFLVEEHAAQGFYHACRLRGVDVASGDARATAQGRTDRRTLHRGRRRGVVQERTSGRTA